ncbi:MAG: ATP-binding protein [candidate division Zixibacteria bacterium]|nr:ATP-binding protein [candidate division Zixibacteria bacterium]
MIKSSIVTAGYALILLLCLPSSSLSQDSDYIELPFEFFHGRWVQGHSGEFKSTYVDYDGPDYFGSYNFTFGSNRLSISDIQKYILVNEKFESWRTANISFLKRVKPNWQIGIDRFTYDESKNESISAPELPFYIYRSERDRLYISASSRFSRNRELKINPKMAAYSYFFEPMLAKGEIRLDNQLSLSRFNQNNYNIFFTDSISNGRTTISDNITHYWSFENLLIWGVTDGINLTAAITGRDQRRTSTSYAETYRQGTANIQSFGENYSRDFNPRVFVSVTSALSSSSFIKIDYQDWLRKRTRRSTNYTNYVGSNLFGTRSYEYETDLKSYQFRLSTNFRFINSGGFDTGVLLDDYQDYYKGMLFRGQFALDLGVQFDSPRNSDSYRYVVNVSPSFGISNHINFSSNVLYQFDRSNGNLRSESVKSSLAVKFRNYSYIKGAGSNWDGDGRYNRLMKQLAKVDLLILDDWGLENLTLVQRNDLFEVMEDRHGIKSTLIAGQVPVSQWHKIIGNATIADAILDRLVHNAHTINLKGESMRKIMSTEV